jgi:hypothetical protein
MTEVIDCTPTWAGVIDIYITALERGSGAGVESAREEIRRLARQYDAACDYIRELEKTTQDLVDLCVECGFEWESLDAVIELLEGDK